jgi:BCD family chlorophyll transporter-like MFS transporter
MNVAPALLTRGVRRLGTRYLPFADAATTELPLARLLRLGLFQVSVGMAMTLLAGTLNRVMIVELGASATLVAVLLSLPLVFAPLRAFIGFRSDVHVSVLGWRRVPYLWTGTMLQFGGLAIMPFALVLLQGDHNGSLVSGRIGSALAFLLVGAGAHTTQTAGLALATDLAPASARPRVVALLYLMLLAGMLVSACGFGAMLQPFSNTRLVQVVQSAALLTVALNLVALWKQEARNPSRTTAVADAARRRFSDAWHAFLHGGRSARLLVATGLGAAGFSMQDVLLEPYGGQVLHLAVGATTTLTAVMAFGAIAAFALAAHRLTRGGDPARLAAAGAVVGTFAFAAVIFASPLASPALFRAGTMLIGFGGGLFSVGTLTAAMALEAGDASGLALGAWGAVQATAAGTAVALGGAIRDLMGQLASHGILGDGLRDPTVGYSIVYHLEIGILFVALVAIGPLAAPAARRTGAPSARFGLAELPG